MATPIPSNRAPFTLADIVAATGGRAATDIRVAAVGVSTDSRAVRPSEVFVALVGERFDGHDHVASACERGASIVVASREIQVPSGVGLVVTSDTTKALGSMASHHRRRWGGRPAHGRSRSLVGITGSAGKTTTRHAVTRALAAAGHTPHASVGNLNNAIGVPMTLLGLEASHDVAVVEMGMNSPGEIAYVTAIARPTIGIVTLVAEAHTEGVGSIWGVLREKSDLLAGLAPSSTSICNVDDPMTSACLARASSDRRITYGHDERADVRIARRRSRGLSGSELRLAVDTGEGRPFEMDVEIPLLGAAGALAAAAALSALLAVDPARAEKVEDLSRVLETLGENEAGRLGASERADGTIVIDDAYNANPASMRSSIQAASELARGLDRRLVLVVGAMFELGDRSDELHAEVGRAAASVGPALVVVVGERAEPLAAAAEGGGARVARAANADAALSIVANEVRSGDVVLVKASNSLGLSKVAKALAGPLPPNSTERST